MKKNDNKTPKTLSELELTITLFQKNRTLTFQKNKLFEKQYSADFILDGTSPKLTVILTVNLSKENIFESWDSLSQMGVFLNTSFVPKGEAKHNLLSLTYSKEKLHFEQKFIKDFRSWPEEMVVSLWKQELFQDSEKTATPQMRISLNEQFVRIVETLDWPKNSHGLIYCSQFKSGELDRILNQLLLTFEKTRSQPVFFSDFGKKSWVNNGDDFMIPTNVPIKKLASFCLATGRFPNLKEVNMLRLEGNQTHKER